MKKFISNNALGLSLALLSFVVIFIIFRRWFLPGIIEGGDLEHYWSYDFFSLRPYAWNIKIDNGLGTFFVPFLWVYMAISLPINFFGKFLSLPWAITQRIIFFYPFLVLSLTSSYLFFKKITRVRYYGFLAAFIYSCNTYILSIAMGGQMVYALAYAMSPFILLFYMTGMNSAVCTLRKSIIAGLIISLVTFLDVRVTYITLVIALLYFCIYQIYVRDSLVLTLKKLGFLYVIPGILVLLINSFWIIPGLIYRQSVFTNLGLAYQSNLSVSFFSFARLENALTLLHPNWPENIFGLTHFMRPEFLLLPILAFSSLLFLHNFRNTLVAKTRDNTESIRLNTGIVFNILFFALLGLFGVFLAKGTNVPFGDIYLWMFDHVPGFVLFRDPTKWYLLIAISYSLLIPFSAYQIYLFLKAKAGIVVAFVFLAVVVAYLLFLIKPAIFGQLQGTLAIKTIPQDYVKFEELLSGQKQFSRTLWLPKVQRYAYYSNNHPSISADFLFNSTDTDVLMKRIASPSAYRLLEEADVEYVVIPYDSEGEIFLKDRKYDPFAYERLIKRMRQISGFKEVSGFSRLHVFALRLTYEHIRSLSGSSVYYKFINPAEYQIRVDNIKQDDRLIFSEMYDPEWELEVDGKVIHPLRYKNYFMYFYVPMGTYKARLIYAPQKLVDLGFMIALVTLAVAFVYLCVDRFARR